MKKAIAVLLVILFIASCAPATPVPVPTGTVVPSQTPTSPPTVTNTPRPTYTRAPTNTPTASLTPAAVTPMPISPLALDETNAAAGMQRLAIYGKGEVHDMAWSPDGSYLAVATGRGIYFFDAVTLEEVRFFDTGDSVTRIAFHPDLPRLAFANCNQLGILNVDTGTILDRFDGGFPGCVYQLAYGPGDTLAAIGWNSAVSGSGVEGIPNMWDVATHEVLPTPETPRHWYLDIAINPDGTLQVIEAQDLGAQSWDACMPSYTGGQFAICIGTSGIRVYDLLAGQIADSVSVAREPVTAAVSPDGHLLAATTWAQEHTVIVLDVASGGQVGSIALNEMVRFDVGVLEGDGEMRYIAAASDGQGGVQVWDLASGDAILNIQAGETEITPLALSPDRRTLAILESDNSLSLWDLPGGIRTATFDLNGNSSTSLAFSPDGQRIYCLTQDQFYFELDPQTGDIQRLDQTNLYLLGYSSPFLFSPNSNLVTMDYVVHYTANENTIQLTDHGTGETWRLGPYRTLGDPDFVQKIALSPDGFYFVTASGAETFIWDLQNERLLYTFVPHEPWGGSMVRSLTFGPASNLLVSTGYDGTTKLWNVQTGQMLRVLNVSGYARFTPDGRLLVTAGDGVIRVWGLPPGP